MREGRRTGLPGLACAGVRPGGRRRRSARRRARSASAPRRTWPHAARRRRRPGVRTAVSPTCRITSPTSRPASAATPLPSSEVITTPSVVVVQPELLARRRGDRRERRAEPVGGEALVGVAGLERGGALGVEAAELELDGLVLALAQHLDLRPSESGAAAATSFGSSRLDSTRLPSKADDDVAGLELAGRRAVVDHVGDERAVRVVQADRGGDLGRDVLDRHAEPAALDRAAVAELRDHGLRRCSTGWRSRRRPSRRSASRSPSSRRSPRPRG